MTEQKEQVISTEENKKTMLDEKQKRKLEKIKQKAQKNPEPEVIHSEDDNRKKPAKKESADYTEDSVGYRIDEKEVMSNGKTKDNQKRNYSTWDTENVQVIQNTEPINTQNKEQEEHFVKSNSEKAIEKKSFADKIMEKNSKKDSNKKENKPLKIDQEEFPDLGNMDQPKKKDKEKEKKEKKDTFEKKDDSDKGFETGKPFFKNSKPKNNSLMADNKTTEVSSYTKTTKEERNDLAFENAPIKFKKSDKAQNTPFVPIVKTEFEKKQEEAEKRAEENRKEKQIDKKDNNEKPEEKRFFKNKKFNSKDENGNEKEWKFTKDENGKEKERKFTRDENGKEKKFKDIENKEVKRKSKKNSESEIDKEKTQETDKDKKPIEKDKVAKKFTASTLGWD